MRTISRNIFLKYLKCRALAWFMRNSPAFNEKIPPGKIFLKEQKEYIKLKARELFPSGVVVNAKNLKDAVIQTRKLLKDKKVEVIYGGVLCKNEFRANYDILKRTGNSWELIEIRPNIFIENTVSGIKQEWIKNIAYSLMVVKKSGINVSAVRLLVLSKDFRKEMPVSKLFIEKDVTAQAKELAEKYISESKSINKITKGKFKPKTKLEFKCRNCDYFNKCTGFCYENHILSLPQMNEKMFFELSSSGIENIKDADENMQFLNDAQKMMIKSVKSRQEVYDEHLHGKLEEIVMPCFYLDFEVFMTAMPLYSGNAPYEHIPFQYSIHYCEKPGKIKKHFEFIADHLKDPRRQLVKKLLKDLKGKGSILTYSSFEKDVVSGLAAKFPEYSNELNKLKDRMIDLAQIVKKHYYHPEFYGKHSIKTVLPVISKKDTYKKLKIADGTSAMAEFVNMARGNFSKTRVKAVKRNLSLYCRQDTLAMVKLHKYLACL